MIKSTKAGIKCIAWVNGFTALITSLFWIWVGIKVFLSPAADSIMDANSKASTLGFLISDVFLAVPILVISIRNSTA